MARIGNEIMFAEEREELSRAARKAVIKGKKQELARIKKGWRYVKITKGTRLSVLVPCNKDGSPTQYGLRRIEKFKESLGIK